MFFFRKQGKNITKSLALLVLVLFILPLVPISAFASQQVDITGTIRDDRSGNPLANVRVDLFYSNESTPFMSTYSDSNGRISVTVLAARTITHAEFSRTGYNRERISLGTYTNTINLGTRYLVEGTTSTEPRYRIYGLITDDRDNAYVADARVLLTDTDGYTYNGYTNSRGNFEIPNVPIGDYEVNVSRYGYESFNRSTLLRVRTADIDLGTIRLRNTGSTGSSSTENRLLTGRITDENGNFVQNAQVYLLDSLGKETKVTSDSRGYYTFRNPEAGTYTIGVTASGYELLERINFVRILSTDREREVNLVIRQELRTGYDVYGRVLDQNKNYLADVEVSLLDGNTRIKRTKTDSRGYYEFRYVQDGRYSLEFKKLGYETRTETDVVRVNRDAFSAPQVEMRESSGTASLVGGLVGDTQAGLRDITVYLENSRDQYQVKTNFYGYFTFSNLRPGEYQLYAMINNQKKLLENGIRLTEGRLEMGDINVNRIGTGYKIKGLLTQDGGGAVQGVSATLTGNGITRQTTSAASGSYEFSGLERGEYRIIFAKEGFGTRTENFIITSFDLNDQNFQLRPNDYVKVTTSREVTGTVNQRLDLSQFIVLAEIYSSAQARLATITGSYEVIVPSEYREYLDVNGTTQVTPRKAGTAYLDITIRDGSQYNNLSPAKVKITITQAAASREAILTIGSNFFVLDGKTDTFDAVPYIKNDRSFFPIRIVARSLGVAEQDIKWDAATQTVTLKKGSDTVAFTVGKNYYKLNGVILYMDVTTENSNGRVFLPVRYVSDALGGEISWNNFTKSITITTR